MHATYMCIHELLVLDNVCLCNVGEEAHCYVIQWRQIVCEQ